MQTKLEHSLITNNIYICEFSLVLCDNNANLFIGNMIGLKNIGLHFSKNRVFNFADPPNINPNSQTQIILHPTFKINEVVTDTINWVTYKFIFKPNEVKSWLTIGLFEEKNGIEMSIIVPSFHSININDNYAYYYIDDVSVMQQSAPLVPNDTTVCNFPFIYTAPLGYDKYLWSNGDTTNQISITQSGTYWLKIYLEEYGYVSDTFTVSQKTPIALQMPANIRLCEDKLPVNIQVNPDFLHYHWSNNDTTYNTQATQEGTYSITVSDICGNQNGNMQVIVQDTIPDFIILSDVPQNTEQNLCNAENYYIRLYPSVQLPNYIWSNGESFGSIAVEKPGTYTLISQNECGRKQAEIHIKACEPQIFIPNAFSPNNDNINDLLTWYSQYPLQNPTMKIYDRWGEFIYETKEQSKGWNGIFKGEICRADVYVYTLEYEVEGIKKLKKGDFSLIR